MRRYIRLVFWRPWYIRMEKRLAETASKRQAVRVRIMAAADTLRIPADGSDIAYVEISMTDEEGRLNPEAGERVSISVEGPGTILGFGSADPESEENYFDTSALPFEGRLRAAVRGTGEKGSITVILNAQGCERAEVRLEAD